MIYSIYTLSDPRTDSLRYVGKTAGPLQKRLKQHLGTSSLRWKSHKNHWVKELLALGLKPIIEEAEAFDSQETMDEGEKFYIAYFKSLGFNLTNSTDGGEGLSPGFKHTAETRAKMSASHKGKPHTPFTAEHKHNIAVARARQVCTPETRAKMRAARIGMKYSDETRAKISKAKLGQKKSEAHRAKISLARIGMKTSPETRAKMSASQKTRWATHKPLNHTENE